MADKALITKRGKNGGTYAHPFVSIKYILDMDPRALMWLLEIASEDMGPVKLCNRLIERVKQEGPYEEEEQATYLYLIRKGGTDHYKIGISTNPDGRLKSLQSANPDKLDLVAYCVHDNAYEVEQSIHEILSDKRLNCEWFELESEMIVYLLREYYGATI